MPQDVKRYEKRKAEIGKRIRDERTRMGLNKKELLKKIYKSEASHKSISAWENGERLPDLESIVRMADLFDCDTGYLLCDYDEKKRVTADIKKQTGLSGEAVLFLLNQGKIVVDVLSSILVQPEVKEWFYEIYRIACELSVCENLKNASQAERFRMEDKRITTLSESVLAHVAIPEIESAELQESKRYHKVLNGVVSDLCEFNENIIEYGKSGAKNATAVYRHKYKLEEINNG